MILILILQSVYITIQSDYSSFNLNFPLIKRYHSNNLKNVSKSNYSTPPKLSNTFNNFKLTHNDICNTAAINRPQASEIAILNQSYGYYIMYLENHNAPSFLFNFFDSPDTNRRLFDNNDRFALFKIPEVLKESSKESSPQQINRNNSTCNSNDKFYFIVFYLTHELINGARKNMLSSNIEFLLTNEVSKKDIYNKFHSANNEFQLLTETNMYSPQQFLIKYLVKELKNKRLNKEDIKTQLFTDSSKELTNQLSKKIDFRVKMIEAKKLDEYTDRINYCIKNRYDVRGIHRNDVIINTMLKFNLKLLNENDAESLKLEFVVDYCVIYNKHNENEHLNGHGEVKINYKGETIGFYNVTKVSNSFVKEIIKYLNSINS